MLGLLGLLGLLGRRLEGEDGEKANGHKKDEGWWLVEMIDW